MKPPLFVLKLLSLYRFSAFRREHEGEKGRTRIVSTFPKPAGGSELLRAPGVSLSAVSPACHRVTAAPRGPLAAVGPQRRSPRPRSSRGHRKGLFLTQDWTSGARVRLTALRWKEQRRGWEMSWIQASKITQVHLCRTSGAAASFRQVERASLAPCSGQI